jgi:hypothetical protein
MTRARVVAGDEDSIIYLLQFGTTFTKQPRITEQQLAGVAVRQAGSPTTVFVPSPLLRARIEDFVTAVASPGTNERLQFARGVIDRQGIDPRSEEGRNRLRRYLEDRTAVVGSAVHSSTLQDPSAPLIDQLTIFFCDVTKDSGTLAIAWDKTIAMAEFKMGSAGL